MYGHSIQLDRLVITLPLLLVPQLGFAQIDLFGNIATTLDNRFKHLSPPFDTTKVFEIGWNVTSAETQFQFGPIGNPPDTLIPVPNTSQTLPNPGPNPAKLHYHAFCHQTVLHTWVITDGMAVSSPPTCTQCSSLVANFNSLPGIDSASPDSGITQLRQGETLSRTISYSQMVDADFDVSAMSNLNVETFFDERSISNLPFEVDVKIGGSFRFQASRGDCGQEGLFHGRCTTATFTQGLGTFYKENPDQHIQPIDDQFVIVKLHGQYTGAIGKTPGNFTCEPVPTPTP
ncbi:MAG TPA: hypothetical protein VMH80_07915 [Bryobacteraceae bacterium]|nr:hypothetical protein [Bryobacteraceae bacterium]